MRVTFLILAALTVVGCGGKSSGGDEDAGGLGMRPLDGIEYKGDCYCSSALMAVCDTFVCRREASGVEDCYFVHGGLRHSCGGTGTEVCDVSDDGYPGCCPVDDTPTEDGGVPVPCTYNTSLDPLPF
jgi:hypothetical protein